MRKQTVEYYFVKWQIGFLKMVPTYRGHTVIVFLQVTVCTRTSVTTRERPGKMAASTDADVTMQTKDFMFVMRGRCWEVYLGVYLTVH